MCISICYALMIYGYQNIGRGLSLLDLEAASNVNETRHAKKKDANRTRPDRRIPTGTVNQESMISRSYPNCHQESKPNFERL